jgi:hypothetical protein
MEEDKEKDGKKVLIVLILLVLLLLAAVVFFLFFFKWPQKAVETPKVEVKQEQPVVKPEAVLEETATSVRQLVLKVDESAPTPDQKDLDKANLEKTSSLFAERLGSFSNQSDFGNILDLKNLMTASMQAWADDYVAKARKNATYDGVYQGTITRAISSDVADFSDGAQTVNAVVHTQKVESSGDVNSEVVYYEDLAVTFKKDGGLWLVDFAKWQDRKDN